MSEYTLKLGSTPLPNEHRIHRVGWRNPTAEVRSVNADVFVRFKHPNIDAFVNNATTCAQAAAGTSIIADVASGQIAVAYAVFYPAWQAYMVAKVGWTIANEMGVELFNETHYGPWAEIGVICINPPKGGLVKNRV